MHRVLMYFTFSSFSSLELVKLQVEVDDSWSVVQ